MARKTKLDWRQRLQEQPVITARLVGAVVSLLVTEFALPVSDEMAELIQIVIVCYAVGPGALETAYQWFKVSPTAKLERLSRGPQLNPDVVKALGRGRR